jgi:aspartate aminotransferase
MTVRSDASAVLAALPPYSSLAGEPSFGWLRPDVRSLVWVGPREIAEAHAMPMLAIGGNYVGETPDHIAEAAAAAARHPAYAHTLGLTELREAIAASVGAELGRSVDANSEVLLTVGSIQSLYLAARVCTSRDRLAVAHAPSFFYRDLVHAAGGALRWSGGDDGQPDWEEFALEVRRPETSVAFVNTPCNPTGYVFTTGDIDAIEQAIEPTACWLISDEAMMSYVYDGKVHMSPAARPSLAKRTLLVRSFSKTYAMGAWRLGYAVGPRPLIAAMAKLLQWSIVAVDGIVQSAALAALQGPQEWVGAMIRELTERRERVLQALNASEILTASLPPGGAVLWARIEDPEWKESELSEALRRGFGIPAVPGSRFGSDTPHLRIPFGGDAAGVEELIERLPDLAGLRTDWQPGRRA